LSEFFEIRGVHQDREEENAEGPQTRSRRRPSGLRQNSSEFFDLRVVHHKVEGWLIPPFSSLRFDNLTDSEGQLKAPLLLVGVLIKTLPTPQSSSISGWSIRTMRKRRTRESSSTV